MTWKDLVNTPVPSKACSCTHPVSGNLALGIVLEMSIALEAALDELSELASEQLVVVQVMNAQTGPGRLGGVSRTDSLLGGADAASAQFDFLQAINDLMEVKDEVRSVRDKESTITVEPFLLKRIQLGEEGRNVHHNARADEACTARVDKT